MLVKCPRCDFSQPKDQYCARCGVDMENYKPPRKSIVKSYLTDPLTYLAVALIVIGVSIGTLYKKERSSLAQKVSFLKGNNLQIASNHGAENRGENKLDDSRQYVPPPPPPAQPMGAQDTAGSQQNLTGSAKAATANTGPIVRIYYAEVPRRALEKLYEESQETGQFNSFGDYTAGILPDVAKRITSEALKIQILEKTEKPISKSQHLFAGVHDSELAEDVGFNTLIEMAESDSDLIRGNLEIVRNWKEGGYRAPASIQKTSYPAVFEMTTGSGFFISGIMPRGQNQDELAKQGPFRILKSQSFQNKESEFVIFVEFDKKP